ncbi:MAG: hypothetical protein ACK40C_04155 [Novosphingobium meiothermophilum]
MTAPTVPVMPHIITSLPMAARDGVFVRLPMAARDGVFARLPMAARDGKALRHDRA